MKAYGAALVLLAGGLSFVWVMASSEPADDPVYQGRRLSEYLDELKLEGPIEETPRSYVAEALQRFGEEAVPKLREMLAVRDSPLRRTWNRWSRDVPFLGRVACQDPRKSRRLALLACHYLGRAAKDAAPEMLELLGEPEWSRDAARALSATGSGTVPLMIARLGDRRAFVRANAAFALGEMRLTRGVGEAVPALVASLDDDDANVRREAARALGIIPAAREERVAALEVRSNDRDATVRKEIELALTRMRSRSPSIVAAIQR